MLPSAEIDEHGKGLFTPNQLHHQDESIIDKDKANPIGLISSVALMLRYSFKLHEEADNKHVGHRDAAEEHLLRQGEERLAIHHCHDEHDIPWRGCAQHHPLQHTCREHGEIGRASCRERV